jgi:hypothetical protein
VVIVVILKKHNVVNNDGSIVRSFIFLKKIAGQWDQDLGRKLISNLERS